jgi:hypothetical protein
MPKTALETVSFEKLRRILNGYDGMGGVEGSNERVLGVTRGFPVILCWAGVDVILY